MAITPAKIHQGPGTLFHTCTVPTDLTLTELAAGVPTGGTDCGATEGDAEIEITAERTEIEAEQSTLIVAAYTNVERIRMTVTLKELTQALLNLFVMQSTSVTCTNPSQSGILLGGLLTTTLLGGMALVSPLRTGLGHWCTLIYSCLADIGTINFGKSNTTLWQLTLTGVAVLTRTAGDQMAQMFENTT